MIEIPAEMDLHSVFDVMDVMTGLVDLVKVDECAFHRC
jgi:hypothetical protein